jgi:hypothetical protein
MFHRRSSRLLRCSVFLLLCLLSCASAGATVVEAAGAKIDLLLEMPGHGLWAVDITRGLSALPAKCFHIACDDVKPATRFVGSSGNERCAISKGVEATHSCV